MKNHQHEWKIFGYTGGDIIVFRCQDRNCMAEYERKMTEQELAVRSQHHMGEPNLSLDHKTPRERDVHCIIHDFQEKFQDYSSYPPKWKSAGYDLMNEVREWAEQYPDDVQIVSCDDSAFCGSILVLIEHKAEKRYMGTTVVFIPQCTGEQPIEFFLYPEHRRALQTALNKIATTANFLEKEEEKQREVADQAFKSVLEYPNPDQEPYTFPRPLQPLPQEVLDYFPWLKKGKR